MSFVIQQLKATADRVVRLEARCARHGRLVLAAFGPVLALLVTGCASDPPRFPDANPETVTLAATNASGTNDASTAAIPNDKRLLGIGDHLTFKIVEDDGDHKQLVVTDSGEVDMPLIGLQKVVGRTCKQLEADLKKAYEAKYYYHATIILSVDSMSRDLGRVYVSGAFHAPGPVEIPGDEVFTLSKAVLRAGGFTDFANTHTVIVTRKPESGGDNQTFTVDVGEILEKGRTDLDLNVKAGDMIYAPERVIRF